MEREDVVELAIAIGGVAIFILALAFVGLSFSVDDAITKSGQLPLLGAVTLFILVMAAGGFFLAERD